jgi:excisionase family DNA binding protein
MDDAITEVPADGIPDAEAEDSDSVLTTTEVASMLNVHVATVRRWHNLGILESFHLGPRGERLFRKKDVITSMLIFKPYSLPMGLL